MRFKIWLNEYAPGGNATMDNPNQDAMARAKDDHKKGVGAFQSTGDNPPSTGKSPVAKYIDKRFKRMKKN